MVNTPVFRTSTVIFPDLAIVRGPRRRRLQEGPLRPVRHAHDLRAGRGRGEDGRRLRGGGAALGARGHHRRAVRVPQDRRPRAGHRLGLRADAHLLRRAPEGERRRDRVLRSPDRRRHRAADPAQHQGGVLRVARARSPSRCRTFRRSRQWRTRAAYPCSRTTPGARPTTSARSSGAWMSPYTRRPSTSRAIPT